MKIAFTADLHYDMARSVESVRELAKKMNSERPDVVVLVGDIGGADMQGLVEALELFESGPVRLLVAGNHDLWTRRGVSATKILDELFPQQIRVAGWTDLQRQPVIVGEVGFVGSVGWYDYSFADPTLEMPMRFYEHKVAPGAAAQLPQYRYLLDDCSDLGPRQLAVSSRWMDGEFVRMDISDPEFTRRLLRRLQAQLRQVSPQVQKVVVAIHHLPFEQMVWRRSDDNWAFGNAFLGSKCFGELLASEPKVEVVVCGHSHQRQYLQLGKIKCINVGCTYRHKRYELVEL